MVVPHRNSINRDRSPLWNSTRFHLRSIDVAVTVTIQNCGDRRIVHLNKAAFINAQVWLFVVTPHFGLYANGSQAHEGVAAHDFDLHPIRQSRRNLLNDRFGVSRLHAVTRTQVGRSQWHKGKQSNEKAHT